MDRLTDDVLQLIFCRVLDDSKQAANGFVWFRSTLPCVSMKWRQLLDKPSHVWTSIVIDIATEVRPLLTNLQQNTSPSTSPRRARPRTVPHDHLLRWLSKRALALQTLTINLHSPHHTLNPRQFPQLCSMLRRSLLQLTLQSPRQMCSRESWDALSVAKALQSLTIHDCPHDFLEVGLAALSFLPKLRQLSFSLSKDEPFEVRNLLLPTQITSLYMANLQFYVTTGTASTRLPLLEQLSIQNCCITHNLTALFNSSILKSLSIISSVHRPQTHLPPLPSLTQLTLTHSPFPTLPFFLETPSKLSSLDLSHNTLDSLPSSLSTLTCLQHLSLTSCSLTALPPLLNTLPSLVSIDLSGNSITSLPKNPPPFVHSLQSINVSANRLSTLPPWVFHLQHLTSLIVSSNAAGGTPGFDDAVLGLPLLKSLNIVGPSYDAKMVRMLMKLGKRNTHALELTIS